MQKQLEKFIVDNLEEWQRLRRQIHQFPELGYEEVETTARLKKFFMERGMEFQEFDHMTGGAVWIDAGKQKTLSFRADMDALPVQERTGAVFASCKDGVMHACGHDMHMAIAAALAHTLYQEKSSLPCNMLIFFQQAEECNPHGGSRAVMQQEFFKQHLPDTVYGLHVWPSLSVGEIGIKSGAIMGSSDRLFIDVHGKSAHAAEPHKGVDAIAISSEVVQGLLYRLNREIPSFENAVISIGDIHSAGRYNIICEQVHIEGTLRCVSEETREYMHQRIREYVCDIAKMHGGSADVTVQKGYSVVNNNEAETKRFMHFSEKLLGRENVHSSINTSLIGEDFSFYSQELPAVFFFLGCDSAYPLHSNSFLPDERVLEQGVRLMASYIMDGCVV